MSALTHEIMHEILEHAYKGGRVSVMGRKEHLNFDARGTEMRVSIEIAHDLVRGRVMQGTPCAGFWLTITEAGMAMVERHRDRVRS
jgi:hypothetical protein